MTGITSPFLTTEEAAAYLGYETANAVRQLIYRGELAAAVGVSPRTVRSWLAGARPCFGSAAVAVRATYEKNLGRPLD